MSGTASGGRESVVVESPLLPPLLCRDPHRQRALSGLWPRHQGLGAQYALFRPLGLGLAQSPSRGSHGDHPEPAEPAQPGRCPASGGMRTAVRGGCGAGSGGGGGPGPSPRRQRSATSPETSEGSSRTCRARRRSADTRTRPHLIPSGQELKLKGRRQHTDFTDSK
jgi:hypothetical protein